MNSDTCRCFVAVPVEGECRDALHALQRELDNDGRVPSGRMVPPENFHLTLAFLGQLDSDSRDRVAGMAEEAAALGVMEAQGLQRLRRFPAPGGRLVVAEGVPAPSLLAMRRHLQEALDAAELPGADHARIFRPHVTLMRLPHPAGEAVDREIDLAMPLKELVLYESVNEAKGVRYRRLAGFGLPGGG